MTWPQPLKGLVKPWSHLYKQTKISIFYSNDMATKCIAFRTDFQWTRESSATKAGQHQESWPKMRKPFSWQDNTELTMTRLQNQSPAHAGLDHECACSHTWWKHYTTFSPLQNKSQTTAKGLVLANTTWENKETNRLFSVVVLRFIEGWNPGLQREGTSWHISFSLVCLLTFTLKFLEISYPSWRKQRASKHPHVHKSPLPQPGKWEGRANQQHKPQYMQSCCPKRGLGCPIQPCFAANLEGWNTAPAPTTSHRSPCGPVRARC